MVWYARTDLGGALAVAMLCVILTNAAFSARRGRLHAALTCIPYALLSLLFANEAAGEGAFGALALCLACAGYIAAAALHHAHRASHARVQDAEWVRQLNMTHRR